MRHDDDDPPLTVIADAVHDLLEPSKHFEWYQAYDETTRRHKKPEKHWSEHPGLLEQLRAAETASTGDNDAPTGGYESRPAARIEAIDQLHAIEQAVDDWLVRRLYTDPRSTVEDNLRALVGAAAGTDEQQQAQLARETRRWVVWARVVTGWDSPPWRPNVACPLCEKRGGLRVRLAERSAACLDCGETWDPASIGVLADYLRDLNDQVETAKQYLSRLRGAVDDYFPRRGPCLLCGVVGEDARHRDMDSIVNQLRAGDAPAWVAEDFGVPIEAVTVLLELADYEATLRATA